MKIAKCNACGRTSFINNHHIDYERDITVELCASCHKKTHMYLKGTVRTGSNPYLNPIDKLRAKGLITTLER